MNSVLSVSHSLNSSTRTCLVLGGSGPLAAAVKIVAAKYKQRVSFASRNSSDAKVDFVKHQDLAKTIAKIRPDSVVFLARTDDTDQNRQKALIASVAVAFETSAEVGVSSFTFVSSSSVYGTTLSPTKLTEDAPKLGTGTYAESKILAESKLQQYFSRSNGLKPTILRVFNMYGQGCDLSLVEKLRAEQTHLWMTDDFVRDYIHTFDVAETIFRAAELVASGTFNLGTGFGISNNYLASLAPKANVIPTFFDGPPSFSIADMSKAQHQLGIRNVSVLTAEYFHISENDSRGIHRNL